MHVSKLLIAAVTTTAAAAALSGPAQANEATPTASGHSPSISPSVQVKSIPPGGTRAACPSGVLCAVVKDPTTGGFKQFFMSACHTYSVSYWLDYGDFTDHQTGNVTSYTYDKNHKVIEHFKPGSGNRLEYWNSIYYIKNC